MTAGALGSSPDTPVASPGLTGQWSTLLDRARHGEGAACGSLLNRCHDYLLAIANQEVPQASQAHLPPSDVVQETFLVALRRLATFRGGSEPEFARWLRMILVNHVRRRIQRLGNQVCHLNAGDLNQLNRVSERHGGNAARLPNSNEQRLLLEERQQALLLAMASLPDHYRLVVELRNLQRKPFQEIGTTLGRSPEASRKLWIRALNMLRGSLQAYDDQSPIQPG